MLYKKIDICVNYKKAGAEQDGSQPQLIAYRLDASPELKNSRRRPAVIICPGGAYRFKSDREAEPIATRFLAAGMHAFILKYSVAPSRYPSSLLELAKSVMIVRENAGKWHVDPDKIMICGFSAGGHLCASLGTLWDELFLEKALEESGAREQIHASKSEEAKPWRPNGMILCYPVITTGEFTHEESCQLLLGTQDKEKLRESLSLDTRVNGRTVPAFLWHTQEDTAVPVENSLLFTMALRRNHIPFELHIYEQGEHGLALCDETTEDIPEQIVPDNAKWIELAIQWIKRMS